MKIVKWLIKKGVINPYNLQFGQFKGTVPQYKDHGSYFKLYMLKRYVDYPTYQKYRIKYSQSYD